VNVDGFVNMETNEYFVNDKGSLQDIIN
jgi:hypothetical protein